MEKWKPVVGYEESYEVSNYGEIRSLDSRHFHKLKNQKQNKDGHMRVWLSKQSKKRAFFVHRLVALAFIENPENKPVINHIDGIPFNNHVDNLEWVTRSENDLHAFRLGLRKPSCGGTSIPVVREDTEGNKRTYKSISEAGRDIGYSPGKINYYIRTGKRYGKYVWKRHNEGVTTIREE